MALRLVDVADGFASSAVPSDLQIQASSFVNFPSAVAYVADKGSVATEGDIFFNTTTNQVEIYEGGAWVPQTNDLVTVKDALIDNDILPINLSKNQTFYVSGSIAAVTLNAHPFGVVAPKNGMLISVVGLSDAKPVRLDFSDTDYGLYMNMPTRIITKGQTITFKWIESLLRYIDVGANF